MAANPLADALGAGRFCYVVELVASGAPARGQAPGGGRRGWPACRRSWPGASRATPAAPWVTTRCGSAPPRGPAGSPPTCTSPASSQDRAGLRKTLDDLQALGIENVFALTGDYPRPRPGGPRAESADLRPRLRPPGQDDRRAAARGPALPRRRGRLAVQVRGGRLRLAVREAREEDRRRRRSARSRRWAGTRRSSGSSSATSRSADSDPRARERVRARPADRRADGARASRPAAGYPRRSSRPCGRRAQGKDGGLPRPAGAGRPDGGRAPRARLCGSLPGRHPRRGADHLDHPPGAGAGPALGGARRGAPLRGPRAASTCTGRAWRASSRPRPPAPGAPSPSRARSGWRSRRMRKRQDGGGSRARSTASGDSSRSSATPCCAGRCRLAAWADRRPAVARAVERLELAVKRPLFGCQACGNCVLGHLEYVCPETCPKQLRNGPCGGTHLRALRGGPDQPCVWVGV